MMKIYELQLTNSITLFVDRSFDDRGLFYRHETEIPQIGDGLIRRKDGSHEAFYVHHVDLDLCRLMISHDFYRPWNGIVMLSPKWASPNAVY